MPVQFAFLQLLTGVYCERNLHIHTTASGMRNSLQCSAHLLHPNAGKYIAGGLDQQWEHTGR